MTMYDPVTDSFTHYNPLEIVNEDVKIELDDPLFDKFEFPNNYRISNGKPVAPPNTVESKEYNLNILQDMANTHSQPSQEVTYNISQNVSGNKKKAFDYFTSKGLKPHHAAAIVGNLMGESKLNPTAVNPKSGAYGIAQWLGNRQKKLFSKYGKHPTFEQQLDFVWEELNGDEGLAYNKLLKTSNLEDATKSFMQDFERPSEDEMKKSINSRIKFSREFLS